MPSFLVERVAPDRRERVAARLANNLIAWLTTVDPDGRPVTVPVWYLLRDDGSILVFSRPGAPKLRHIAANPHVSLVLDVSDLGRDVVRVEGRATAVGTTLRADEVPAYATKYAERVAAIFGTIEAFADRFTEAIVVTPSRLRAD